MNKKILLALIVFVIIIIVNISYLSFQVYKKEQYYNFLRTISEDSDYYSNYRSLASRCKEKIYSACCYESLSIAVRGNYRLLEMPSLQKSCPENHKMGWLDCPGSYHWCEPTGVLKNALDWENSKS